MKKRSLGSQDLSLGKVLLLGVLSTMKDMFFCVIRNQVFGLLGFRLLSLIGCLGCCLLLLLLGNPISKDRLVGLLGYLDFVAQLAVAVCFIKAFGNVGVAVVIKIRVNLLSRIWVFVFRVLGFLVFVLVSWFVGLFGFCGAVSGSCLFYKSVY